MDDIYKAILNEIAKPIASLNNAQMKTVIAKLEGGTMDERRVASSVKRLDNYINLSLALTTAQGKKLREFVNDLMVGGEGNDEK